MHKARNQPVIFRHIQRFESQFGWFGLAWSERGLAALTFGHQDAEQAWATLERLGVSGIGAKQLPHLNPLPLGEGRVRAGESGKLFRTNSLAEPMEGDSDPPELLISRLRAYCDGQSDDFLDVPLDLNDLTDFQRRVSLACRQIPWGQTCTYGELASRIGSPGAARAVGSVMARNRLPIVIPCHRVLGAGRRLGGYSAPGGLDTKRRLLSLESAQQ
jgi:O-6-methylguanine DNA methyltransferase